MKIAGQLAKQIVREMMNVVPYNINVMDENGIIVGSGDLSRIGTLHEGARIAIQSGQVNEVYEDGIGMKPGINEPIIVNKQVIGVVGITGHPDAIRPFSRLVRVTTVLLIEQEERNKQEQDERVKRVKFFHELAYRKNLYDPEFLQRAASYGLDLTKKCWAMTAEGKVNAEGFKQDFRQYPHYWNLENDHAVFFVTDPAQYRELLDRLCKSSHVDQIGAGGEASLAAHSLEQATAALHTGKSLNPYKKLYLYDELSFMIGLSHEGKDASASLYTLLDQAGDKTDLIKTLQIFIAENGDQSETVKRLNIHRNTLRL
ncbi:CdaR family transcriptional regulator [Paenibacillus sp. CAA11]|uniref:CdaR family transcriptional regulator n=1 Tax=Paenibacillus sp. CAA11 TaxID=1532905 RepID=UPI001F1EB2DC|nr:sugar diacid recognition domain-containing protein [Paenibacillus sp. CAA11]